MRRSVLQGIFSNFSLAAFVGALFYAVVAAEEPEKVAQQQEYKLASPVPKSADHYVGPQACMECHQAEYQIWSRTNHATSAYNLLRTSSNAKRYAENLGLNPHRVADQPRCLACHSTPQGDLAMHTGAVFGVTCEACHNAAGGEEGWLNSHAIYGPRGARREDETPEHRRQRIARCRAAGQYRCDDLYSLAKQCYQCHIVGDEELVVDGGHHPGNAGFEMTTWFDQSVRHNLCLDPSHNGLAPSLWIDPLWRTDGNTGKEIDRRRLMYVVGTLVDLELSLRNRARATQSSFATSAAVRVVSASSRLATISENTSLAELERAVDAVAKLQPILFTTPAEDNASEFLDAARVIRDIAQQVASSDEGQRYPAADRLLGSHSK